MSIGGYKIRNKQEIHFVSFAVVDWVDVFTRKIYRDIVVDSIRYCQKEKGLLLYAWCIMSNHVHLLMAAKNQNLSDMLRDFKKITAKEIIKAIEQNEHESRKNRMLKLFKEHGAANSRNSEYQFWRQENHPEECYSAPFSVQKLNYIHNNPVVAGIVERPEDYLYSSARCYYTGKNDGLRDVILL